MALTPRTQLKRLTIGTVSAFLCALLLVLTSGFAINWLFYLLSLGLIVSVFYAIPGYLGIWLWRMRHFFFDLD